MVDRSAALSRLELEESWRRDVERARARYFEAVEVVNRLSQASSGGDCGFELVKAHRQETAARNEYLRVLQVFAELTRSGSGKTGV